MSKQQKKLNSMRLLEANKIPYEVLEYDPQFKDAMDVADAVGIAYFMVYKTLVVQSVATEKPMLVMLACDRHLDLKKFATVTSEKKLKMAKHADAESMTGLQVGGISALMLTDKRWAVYLDKPATELEHIVISAGQRGMQLRVPVTPLLMLVKARVADVSSAEESEN